MEVFMNEILFLQPVLQEKIWGGRQLAQFGYDLPSDKVGECWGISAHPNGESIVKNGSLEGQTLSRVFEENRDLFGDSKAAEFPLLIKILDAQDDLSVQVHPDDEYGKEHAGELGKTECWYVIDAKEGAEIIFGHTAKTHEEFNQRIDKKEWDQLFTRVPVKAGDFFYVKAGTLHAIGSGILILETQQSSDTTYRVYDYNRLGDDGLERPLHIQESKDVTMVPNVDGTLARKEVQVGDSQLTSFGDYDYFSVEKWDIDGQVAFTKKQPYQLCTVIDGQGSIEINSATDYPLKKGDHFILTSNCNEWTIIGKLTIISSHPGDLNQ